MSLMMMKAAAVARAALEAAKNKDEKRRQFSVQVRCEPWRELEVEAAAQGR